MGTHAKPIQYLTLYEAEELGYGAYSTLRTWIRQGKLPAFKTGSRVKVKLEDLENLATPHGRNTLDAAIDKLVASAPKLTESQKTRISELLGGVK